MTFKSGCFFLISCFLLIIVYGFGIVIASKNEKQNYRFSQGRNSNYIDSVDNRFEYSEEQERFGNALVV